MRKKNQLMKGILVVLCVLSLVRGASYAEFVYCSLAFPGNCDQGGCKDAVWASDCILKGCFNGGPSFPCEYFEQ